MDLSKGFDRVWYERLLCKLETAKISGDLLNLFQYILSKQYQMVGLNRQESNWSLVKAGVTQDSILGSTAIFVFHKWSSWWFRLFSDETLLVSTISDSSLSLSLLNNDLAKVSEWAYKWKMTFNPDVKKQAQEVIFSRKSIKTS